MKNQAKHLYDRMSDYKRFAMVLLAVGSIFYLGVILPETTNNMMDLYIMMGASVTFLAGSIYFFKRSKHLRTILSEMEDGQ